MKITSWERYSDRAIVIVHRQVGPTEAFNLYGEIKDALGGTRKRVLIDLSNCKNQDQSLLAVLLLVADDLKKNRGFTGVVGIQSDLKRHLEQKKYKGILFYSSLPKANKALRGELD